MARAQYSPTHKVHSPIQAFWYRAALQAGPRPSSPWGAMAMCNMETASSDGDPAAALALMEQALEHLDRSDQALEVGAQLDLAICRLRSILGLSPPVVSDEALCEEPRPWPIGSRSFAA